MDTFNYSTAAERSALIANGPIVAKIGTTVDSGLERAEHYVIPCDPTDRAIIKYSVSPNGDNVTFVTGHRGS